MSNLETRPDESSCGGVSNLDPSPPEQTLVPREVPLGGPKGVHVLRTLPHREIRTVGAWCFLDHYGPVDLHAVGERGMQVPPHPHIGLQTVSWLLEGEVEHRDSVGGHAIVRPGEMNLMTAGRGIAHSEYSLPTTPRLFGVQLWVALPEEHRSRSPHFEYHADLPRVAVGATTATVLMGEFAGALSGAATYTPIVGAEVMVPPGGATLLPLERGFEYAVLTAEGFAQVGGARVPAGSLHYLGWGRESVRVESEAGTTLLVLGGEPLAERLLMWWNFVARDHDEIVAAREAWVAGLDRFGEVVGDSHPRLPAPPLPGTRMKPRSSRPRPTQ